ncbi:AMP-binding enzyme [Aspergillus similis]
MSIVRSQYSATVPPTDLLSYIFGPPYKDEGAWPSSEPILQLSKESSGGCACGYSIDQIKSLVKRLGNGLHHLGARGKPVMIYGEANIHFAIAVLGILAAGAEVNILASGPAEYLVSRLRQLKCETVLCSPEQKDAEAVLDAAGVLGIPRERLFIVDESLCGSETLEGKVKHWSYLLDTPGGDLYEWPRLSPDEAKSTTAVLLYTSGTTGTPKLACRTHYGLIGNIAQTLSHYTLRPRCNEIVSCNYKFAGMGFLLLGIMIPLKARYKSIFPSGLDLITFTATVERFKPTWVMAPPHLMRATLAVPTTLDFGSVNHVLTGGSIVSWELVDEWQRRFGSQVQSTYGMTEAGFFAIPDPNEPVQDATTGILLPNVEAKILDESGNVLPPNKKGDICIRTPYVMKGYLDEPMQTAQTVEEDGWIKTGDIGWINERGMVYVVGRRKDLFKFRGDQVTGSEIETAVARHPSVRDVAVIPVVLPGDEEPCPRGYIVKRDGSSLSIEELMSWMTINYPPRMQLTGGAAFIDAIPISSIGNSKVDRRKLSELAGKEFQLACAKKGNSQVEA